METSDFAESTVEADIDLYDSDRVALNEAINKLRQYSGTRQNLEGFRQRCIEMMLKIGFKTDVRVFEGFREGDPAQEKMYFFKMVINGRVDPIAVGEFDHDRMQHEVLNDYLGTGNAPGKKKSFGMSSTDPNSAKRTKSGLYLPGS